VEHIVYYQSIATYAHALHLLALDSTFRATLCASSCHPTCWCSWSQLPV